MGDVGVGRKLAIGDEVLFAFDGEAQRAAESAYLGEAAVARLRKSQAKVAQPESPVRLRRVHLG